MSYKPMEGLDELFDYKNQLITDMLGSSKIVRLLHDDLKPCKEPESLLFNQIFPYEYVPETTQKAKTFVCCEVDIEGVYDKTFLHTYIYIWVFTQNSMLRLPNNQGLRVDELASAITKEINGSRVYGLGTLELHSAKRFSPINTYQGRILKFYTKDFNRPAPHKHPIPAYRKVPR